MASDAEKNSEEAKRERKIPVFTVIKNGAILKNIFVINNPPSPSSDPSVYEEGSAEEILTVGRHPDCNIMLMHPSISRFHLRINSKPYSQKLFVTDLSSVHGTWVSEKKIEPGITVEFNEGDTIRLGGSTRIYKLHWVPLSRAYDTENPFVSEADLEMLREKEEESEVLEEDASEMAKYQDMNSLSDGNDGSQSDSILEAEGFSFGDENCGPIVQLGNPSAHSVLEADAFSFGDENCGPIVQLGKPQAHSVSENINLAFASSEIEKHSTNDHHAREILSPRIDSLQTKKRQSVDYNLSLESLTVNDGAAETEMMKVEPESNVSDDFILSAPTVPKNINPFLSSEEIETLSNSDHDVRKISSPTTGICGIFETKYFQFNEQDLSSVFHSVGEAVEKENRENTLTMVRADSNASDGLDTLLSFPVGPSDINCQQVEEKQTSEAPGVLQSAYEEGNSGTSTSLLVNHKSVDLNGTELCGEAVETGNTMTCMVKVEPESNVSEDMDFSVSSPGYLSNIKNQLVQENQTSEALAAQEPLHDNLENFANAMGSYKSDVLAATEVCGEVANHSPESLGAFMPVCKDGKMENFMQPADPKATETCGEVTYQSFSKNCCEGTEIANVHYEPLAAELINSSFPMEEVFSELTESKENQTTHSVFDVVENGGNMKSSVIMSQEKLSLCNIWSRRGKPDAPLQLLTSRNNRKASGTAGDDDVEWETQEEIQGGLIAKDIFSGLEATEEFFTPGKENCTPNATLLKSLKKNYKLSSSKISFSPNINSGESTVASSDKENHTPRNHLQRSKLARTTSSNQVKLDQDMVLNERRAERIPLQSLYVNLSGMRITDNLALDEVTISSNSVNCAEIVQRKTTFEDGRRRWVMVADTTTLLDKESRKSLQLLQGLNRTRLVIPEMVTRELDCLKRRGSLFRRKTEACMALEWIEECMIKTKWWVHVESSVKDGRPITPTPRGSPQSRFCKGCEGFSHWKSLLPNCSSRNLMEVETPTADDRILESGLYYRRMTKDEQLVLLSNDVTLTIKAMAEGLLCETAQGFRKSLLNPFSERFMWADSSPRGQTWSVLDDLVLKENFYRSPSMKSSNAKGLKLILLHNSHYGKQQISGNISDC